MNLQARDRERRLEVKSSAMKENKVSMPKDFSTAVRDIKLAILQARDKAARLANAESLKLYFYVGGYI